MTSLARIRPYLRLAAFVAALCALLAPATAGASVHAHAAAKKKKAKPPVVTSVRPMNVEIGQTLEIRGKYFIRGRYKNTVAFKHDGGRAVFAKAKIGTTRLLRVTVPSKLTTEFTKKGTTVVPTRFRIRVLSKKFGKKFTTLTRSPLIAPKSAALPPGYVQSQPDGDCDNDGVKNKVDRDDDNDSLADSVEASLNLNPCTADTDKDGVEDRWEFDCDRNGVLNRDEADDDKDLLNDGLEQAIGTNPCSADSDGDGVTDGYEFKSAQDLNDDEDQEPNSYLPYPGKRPYPNPLFADAGTDYDGDTLTLAEEYRLWKYVGNRTLTPLSYSDGEQYSASTRGADGHRVPTLAAAGYSKQANFVSWANAAHYREVTLWGAKDGAGDWYDAAFQDLYGLFDVDRSAPDNDPGDNALGERPSELSYNDIDGDGWLSDNERDEDADGLTNYDESHGRMLPTYWSSCYTGEKPYHIGYAGTDLADPDSDGDLVRDGADDQDHDDIPNVDELSRIAASGLDDRKKGKDCVPKEGLGGGNFTASGGPLPDGAVGVTFVNERGNRDVAQMTASGAGLTGGTAPTVTVATTRQGGGGVDEQQTVTITGGPTGGGFTLTFEGNTTRQIAFNADAKAVEAALKELVPGDDSNHPTAFGRVNPYNPCLPFRHSRTCPTAVNDSTGAPFDGSLNWAALQ
jgi:hypothetical protein